MRYELECLLCGQKRHDLVVMQEHVMEVHLYTQGDLMAQVHRHEDESIIYTIGNKDWLKATRIE